MNRPGPAWRDQVRRHLADAQHRTAYILSLNNVLGAATGFLFWLLFARLAGLDSAAMGLGYAAVALGTVIGVVAKGGMDTAMLEFVPHASSGQGRRLLGLSVVVGAGVALALAAVLAMAGQFGGLLPGLSWSGWALVAAIAILMLVSWLQDAYFVALGHARYSLERNLVLSTARVLMPLPIVALALLNPVALTWMVALAASALAGLIRLRSIPSRSGRAVSNGAFLSSSMHNVSGAAAEFLPGLLLAPLVLAIDGPAAAAYFGIAWTAASLFFQTSSAIGRSALAQMIRTGPVGVRSAIRRAILENLLVVAPAALIAGLLAPQLLSVFGRDYAQEGAAVLMLLCASIVFVAPASLYLAVLRSRGRSRALHAFPASLVAGLAILAPPLGIRYGLTGVAVAWLVANVPLGAYAAWRLHRSSWEVMPLARAAPVAGSSDLE